MDHSWSLFDWLSADPTHLAVAAVICLLLLAFLVRRGRPSRARRDPLRAFDSRQRQRIHARAQHQCEHRPPLLPRCPAAGTQADHIYPHVRGGATSVANAQSLCARHNRSRSARIPSRWYIARLERRRRKYFPSSERVEVDWSQAGV